VGHEILAQKVVVEFEDHRRVIVGRDDLLEIEPPRGRGAGSTSPGASLAGPSGLEQNDPEEDDRPSDP
jgi:hypothetical protein